MAELDTLGDPILAALLAEFTGQDGVLKLASGVWSIQEVVDAPPDTSATWGQDSGGDTIFRTATEEKAFLFAGLTGGLYSTAGVITAQTPTEHSAVQFAALTGVLYSTAGTMTAIPVYGKNNIFLPAACWTPRTSNGCAALANTESSTHKHMLPALGFDTASDEYASTGFWLPKSYNASTATFRPIWTAASGSGTVCFALQARVFANDDAFDQAFGTEQTSTDTLITALDMHEGPASSAITFGGTPAKERYLSLQIYRDVSADTLGVDALFLGLILDLTTNAATDD